MRPRYTPILLLVAAFSLCAQTDVGRARDLVVAGRPLEAIPLYEALVRKFPDSAQLHLELCIADFKAHRYREAISQAEAALKLRSDLLVADLFLGSSYVELREYAKAVEPLENVIRAEPNDRNARVMLAQAFENVKRFAEAAEQFRKAAELAPDSPKVWYGLGQCYEKMAGEHHRAIDAWDRLMSLPPSRESHMHAADASERAGAYVEAATSWREALKSAPGDPSVESALVWALYKGRDYEAALGVLGDIQNQDTNAAELNFLHGACLLNLEQPEQSIPYIEKALRSDPRLLPAHRALGQALLRTQRAKEAIPHLKTALPLDQDGSGHYQLFRAYQMVGDTDAAARALVEFRKFTSGSRLSNP
jgi:tetratricopeptide (TPR) repeat protein